MTDLISMLLRFVVEKKQSQKKCPGSEKCNLGYDCLNCKYDTYFKKLKKKEK